MVEQTDNTKKSGFRPQAKANDEWAFGSRPVVNSARQPLPKPLHPQSTKNANKKPTPFSSAQKSPTAGKKALDQKQAFKV